MFFLFPMFNFFCLGGFLAGGFSGVDTWLGVGFPFLHMIYDYDLKI